MNTQRVRWPLELLARMKAFACQGLKAVSSLLLNALIHSRLESAFSPCAISMYTSYNGASADKP
jgi:hypothetical protein